MPYQSFPAFESFQPYPSSPLVGDPTPPHPISSIPAPPFHYRSRDSHRPAAKRPRPCSPTASSSSGSISLSSASSRSDPRGLLHGDRRLQRKGLAVTCATVAVASGRREWTENRTLNIFLKNTDGYFDESDSSDDEEEEEEEEDAKPTGTFKLNPLKFLFSRYQQEQVRARKKLKKDVNGSHFYL